MLNNIKHHREFMIYLVSIQVCMHMYGQDDLSDSVRFLLDYVAVQNVRIFVRIGAVFIKYI